MKGSVVALGTWQGRSAAALVVDGVLEDLLVDPPDDTPMPGAVYRAICDRPMKGQGGITVQLGNGQRGYLRGAKGLRPGQPILVQVMTYAEPGKAAPVTTRLLFKSRYAIATPANPGVNVSRQIKDDDRRDALKAMGLEAMVEGQGLILRSSAETAVDAEILADIAAMRDLASAVSADAEGEAELLLDGADATQIAWCDWPKPDILAEDARAFEDHGILDLIEAVCAPRVDLPGGGHAYVEPTRALVAVDINTGADSSLAAGLKANIALARALPRILRCRGLGGQITLDTAPLSKRDRSGFETALRAAFRADPIETTLAGWTPLGAFELQRKRERAPLDWR